MDLTPDSGVETGSPPDGTQDTTPTGREAVTNSGEGQEQAVPFSRFQEVNDAKKVAEERAAEAERKLQESTAAQPSGNEPDPDVEKTLDDYAKRHGLMTKGEFEKQQQDTAARIQVRQDTSELRTQYKESGVPFDDKAVFSYMKDHNMSVTSKDAMDAAYQHMNREKIMEAARNKAIADFQEGAKSGAERPGPGGSKPPAGNSQPAGLRGRIHTEVQKLRQTA